MKTNYTLKAFARRFSPNFLTVEYSELGNVRNTLGANGKLSGIILHLVETYHKLKSENATKNVSRRFSAH